MINQTKSQLFEVFKKFDKDGNGYVDSNELITISKEMNEEITQDDVQRLMKVVDTNGDGKISFEEFWQWWQYGKQEKLERLVFLKLKLMNLLKSVNYEFTRYGISLEQKYEPKLDHHYWAINYGDFQPHLRIYQNVKYNGAGVSDELLTLNGFPQAEQLQFVIILKATKPAIAKQKLEELWNEFKQYAAQDTMLDSIIGPIIQHSLDIVFQERKDCVAIQINVNHPLLETVIQQAYMPYCQKLGKNLKVDINFNFGIKNGLQKMMKKDQIFIKYLLEGFLLEFKASFNSDMIKKVFGLLMSVFSSQIQELKAKRMKNQGKEPNMNEKMILPLLFRSSKFHLQFKNMEDVDQFLRSLGLDDLARDQPTARQLIDDMKQDFEIQQMMDENSQTHFIFKLFQVFAEYFIAQGSININIPYAYLQINFNLEGLKEFYDAIFQIDEKKQKQMQNKKNVKQPI